MVLGGASLILGEASLILGEASTVMEIPAFIQNRPKTRPAWQGLGMERGLSQLAAGGMTGDGSDNFEAGGLVARCGLGQSALRGRPCARVAGGKDPAKDSFGWTNGAKVV